MANADATFRTSRTLPFPADAVYGAFESPEQLARWWGPAGFSNTFERFEFREGDRWTFVMHGPDGKDYPNENVFLALSPGSKIALRHDCPPYFTLTVTLDGASDVTLLTWEQTFDDPSFAQAVASIVVPANEQNLDRLTTVLETT